MTDRSDIPWRSLRAASRAIVKRKLDLTVEGADFVPSSGPAIIAAHHHHHLYDGCALLATVPRPLHILVALDWTRNQAVSLGMKNACRAARWPTILRTDGPSPPSARKAAAELRRASRETLGLLREGRMILIFPEAYPAIDPVWTPKTDESVILPFHHGVVRFAAMAAREGIAVPIVPAGFSYGNGVRQQVSLRFGEPLWLGQGGDERVTLTELEARVRRLSSAAGAGHQAPATKPSMSRR